jgi:hypothetical protein
MQQVALSALLAVSLLVAGNLQAWRGGGAIRGGAARHSRAHGSRNSNATLVPLWYDQPSEYESPPAPVVIMEPPRLQPVAPTVPPASSRIIEVPGTANSPAAKPRPPAEFILRNGDRLEARRYLLTYDHLSLTIDRQQRTVPLGMLDLDATVAANRARGIDLRIPADRSEISVGF